MNDEFHILLVEDSRADVTIIARALHDCEIAHRLTVLHDGRHAMEYLNRLHEPDISGGHQPDIVLLDLNLPGIDGFQVLAEIKAHPFLRALPVVILSTSGRDEDVYRTYDGGANSFIRKPDEYPSYCELVRSLRSYWRDTSLRPRLKKVD